MKKITLLLAVILTTFSGAFAQISSSELDEIIQKEVMKAVQEVLEELEEEGLINSDSDNETDREDEVVLDNDSTQMQIGNMEITFKRKVDQEDENLEDEDYVPDHRGIKVHPDIRFGFNALLSDFKVASNDVDGYEVGIGKSFNFAIGAGFDYWFDKKAIVGIGSGVSMDFDSYRFDDESMLLPGQDDDNILDGTTVRKNVLHSTSIRVPLVMNLNFGRGGNPWKTAFRISGGGYAEVIFASHTKLVTNEIGKIKTRDDFDLNRFQYGLNVELGIPYISLYADYAFSQFFKDGKGPELNRLTVGFHLSKSF